MKKPNISNFLDLENKGINWFKYAEALEEYIRYLEGVINEKK